MGLEEEEGDPAEEEREAYELEAHLDEEAENEELEDNVEEQDVVESGVDMLVLWDCDKVAIRREGFFVLLLLVVLSFSSLTSSTLNKPPPLGGGRSIPLSEVSGWWVDELLQLSAKEEESNNTCCGSLELLIPLPKALILLPPLLRFRSLEGQVAGILSGTGSTTLRELGSGLEGELEGGTFWNEGGLGDVVLRGISGGVGRGGFTGLGTGGTGGISRFFSGDFAGEGQDGEIG